MSRRFIVVLAALAATMVGAGTAHAAPGCPQPAGAAQPATASPASVDLDPRAVAAAVAYASTHDRLSMRVYRHGCLVAKSALDPLTERVPFEVFSSTKSVVSMLAGIAYGDGKLALDAPIGRYLPDGWGDAAHRAITVRQLLTETAGLKQSILSEFATVGLDRNVALQALALPLVRTPGSAFEYSQRTPDLLAYVVQRAVGQDLQAFAQARLFGPLGIARGDYVWLRDRARNTYGYANLFIAPRDFAKLGLLMLAKGTWNGRSLISRRYIHLLRRPTATNPCYGFLFWLNAGATCTTAAIPSARTLKRPFVPSAPRDMYAMVGALQQNNFIVPSLDMLVTFTGLGGDVSPDPQAILSADPGADLYYNVFRLLMRGVRDRHVPDPGPYVADRPNFDFTPENYLSPTVLLGGLGLGPDAPPQCTLLSCPVVP